MRGFFKSELLIACSGCSWRRIDCWGKL